MLAVLRKVFCRRVQSAVVGESRLALRGHDDAVGAAFTAPRTLIAASKNWSTTSAHADVCQPQAIQSKLLSMKAQKPISRRAFFGEATSQAAITVTAIAGHCRRSIASLMRRRRQATCHDGQIDVTALK